MTNIKPLTEEEILEANYQHFVVGKNPLSFSHTKAGPACKYRDQYGHKCAIGCLIPDELYLPRFDTQGGLVVSQLLDEPNIGQLLGKARGHFLISLQHMHDGLATDLTLGYISRDTLPRKYQAKLVELANQYHIDWSPK
jgi:hypothetical protein